MIDSKTLLLTVLLFSQLSAHASENKPSQENIEKRFIEAVISEDELNFLLQKKVLFLNENGTFSVNKKAWQSIQKLGFEVEKSKAASICME